MSTTCKRNPRDYTQKRAQRVLRKITALFRKEIARSMTVNDVAKELNRTPRATRDWLYYLHENGVLFIESYKETTAVRGKKLAAYRIRRGNEQDATKWWLEAQK